MSYTISDKKKDLFFELIRVAIGTQETLSRHPSEAEWEELFEMALKQSLVGVCFVGLHTLGADSDEGYVQIGMSEDLFFDWMGMAAQINMKNDLVNQQCVELQKRLAAEGFRSCILKGQGVAALYGEEIKGFRQSGDIDVWIDGSREEILNYVNKVSSTPKVRWLHTKLNVFDDTEVEAHFLPTYMECPWYDKALQMFIASEREGCFNQGKATTRFNQVFILAHAFRHLFGEGVGLRQMMDYYFVLRSHKPTESDKSEYRQQVKSCGMLRFAESVMWLIREVFGLEDSYLLCECNESDGKFLLSEIMMAGNFGHNDERNKHDDSESVFARYIRLSAYSLRVFRFSPWTVIWSPIWRLKHWIWRKTNGYK